MKCHTSEIDIETLFNRIQSDELNLQPDFQRGEVWSDTKKKKLIDSILRGWKIPPIHVIQTSDFKEEVLDGQQRLVAIRDYMENKYPIDGGIVPLSVELQILDKLYFSELPNEIQRRFKRYTINLVTLTDYLPAEPAELFFRLNQPTKLTSAEQRNAFIGKPRDQVKALSKKFEELGANKESIGFSNSRMAYDEIISKLCYSIENKNISRKITSNLMSDQYRSDIPFSDKTTKTVGEILTLFLNSVNQIYDFKIMFSKASVYSWMLFIKKNNITSEKLAELISLFEFSRAFVRSGTENGILYSELSEKYSSLKNEYPFYEVMLNIYNQRASMGSTDGSSIVIRDFILNTFNKMLFNKNDNSLKDFIFEIKKRSNLSEAIDESIRKNEWGENF